MKNETLEYALIALLSIFVLNLILSDCNILSKNEGFLSSNTQNNFEELGSQEDQEESDEESHEFHVSQESHESHGSQEFHESEESQEENDSSLLGNITEGITNDTIQSDFEYINEKVNDYLLDSKNNVQHKDVKESKPDKKLKAGKEPPLYLRKKSEIPRKDLGILESETESDYSSIDSNVEKENVSKNTIETFSNVEKGCPINDTEQNVEEYIKKLLKNEMHGCQNLNDETDDKKNDENKEEPGVKSYTDVQNSQLELFDKINGSSKDNIVNNTPDNICSGVKPDEIHKVYDKLNPSADCKDDNCVVSGVSSNNFNYSNL